MKNPEKAAERAKKRAAYAKAWRERFKTRDPGGFKEYTLRKSRESYQRQPPEKRREHAARSLAWIERWKAADPDGARVYFKKKNAEHNERRQQPGYRRKAILVNGCNVGDRYLLARRLIKHGIAIEDYDSMFEVLPACAICRKAPRHRYALHIDHDHATGRVRGLLCSNCNSGIGKLGDDVAGLRAALEYLGG